ncbi:MAG: alpha/beta hydrolase [Streptococcaceae bacterium]|jgi:pimeloyl-ACP methyl ester carboxylesterase|nr:alpha/beta hydrolase [Streptococcaceae bacterium]
MIQQKALIVNDGSKIYYEIIGKGFPLVMLHGNNDSGRIFSHQVAFLKDYYTCIVVDSRGHGKSTNASKTLEFKQMSDDLCKILDKENITKAHLLGFSDGGNIAACFVVDHSKYVEKLILNAANLKVSGLYLHFRILSKLEIWKAKLLKHNIAIKKLMLKETKITVEDLQKIKQPTLILVGQFDVVRNAHSKNLAKQIPNAMLKTVPYAKHLFLKKSPVNYNKIVLAFLQEKTSILGEKNENNS